MKELARGFDHSCGFLFAALLTSRVLIFGFEDYSAGNAFVAVVCVMLVAVCGLSIIARQEARVARSRAWIPLGAYLFFCLIGVIAASNRAAAWREFGSWAIYAGAFAAAATWARTEERRRLVFASFLAAACVEAMYAFLQRRVGLPLLRRELALDPGASPEFSVLPAARGRLMSDEAWGTFVYPNALAGFLVLALVVSLAFAYGAAKRKEKLLSACAILVSGTVLLSFFAASAQVIGGTPVVSMGGWVALFAAAAALATRRLWLPMRGKAVAGGIGALLLGSLAAPLLFSFASARSSVGVRREYWKAALSMVRAHPFGVGLANFGEHYPAFKTVLGTETREAHNAFLQNWTELGLWGMLAFAALWWALIADASEKPRPADEEKETGLVYLGLCGGMFAFFVGYAFLNVLNSGSVGAFLVGSEAPYLGLNAACHLLYPLVWLGVFACAMKVPPGTRAFLACALAGLLVHSAVDFDMRIKGIVLPALALAGAAGWARGEARFRLTRRGTLALAVGLAVVVVGWVYFLAARPLLAHAARARAEWMDATRRRIEVVWRELAVLRVSSPPRAVKAFIALAETLPGHELDGVAGKINAAKGADGEDLLREAVSLIPQLSRSYTVRGATAWAEFASRAPLAPEAYSSVARALGTLTPPTRGVIQAWEHSLKKAIELGGASPGRWESLGHFYAGFGRFRDATVAYEKAIERYPLKPVYRCYLGDAFLRFSPEKAREEYGTALDVNRRIIDDACMLQELFWNRVSYVRKGAVELRTLDLLGKEEAPESRVRLGLLLGSLGRRKEAKKVFSGLAGDFPDDPQLLAFLACARETTLDPRARATWERLKSLQSASPGKLRAEAVSVLLLRRRWMRSVR